MCASPLRGAAAPVGAAEYELPLSAFCFRFFVLSVIRAKAALANASTGIGLLQLRMERRMKSAVTVHITGVTWLGCKAAASRERESISLSPLGRGRLASSASKSGEGGSEF